MAGFVRLPPVGGENLSDADLFNFAPQLTSDQSGTEASSRLFVGNLTLDSQTSVQTGFGGGVVVASGDVNGDDNEPDVLVANSGSDWTLDDGLLLPAVQTDDAVTFTAIAMEESTGNPDAGTVDAHDFIRWQKGPAPADPVTFTATVRIDPSASSDTPESLMLVTDADLGGAVAGIVIAATSDNNRLDDDDSLVLGTDADLGAVAGVVIAATSDNNRAGADYSGSHAMYQDVVIPQTLDTGSWLI